VKPLRVDQHAEAELKGAISWYERERAGLGDELWAEAQQALRTIIEHPDVGGKVRRVRIRNARRLPLRRFPYFVVYREHPDYLEVIAFAHQSRRPGYWRARGV